MAKSSNYWDKRALSRLQDAEKIGDAYNTRIKKIYEKAYRDIEDEIQSVYRNYAKDTGLDTQKLKELLTRSETKKTWEQMKRQGLDKYIKGNYKSRISRLEQIQAQIYAKAKLIYQKEELEQKICYKGVINNSYYKTVYDTQIGTGYDFSFNRIDDNTLEMLLSERWSGANYSERIWQNTDILAKSLSETLSGAILSGQSIEKTAKQIRDRFDVGEYYSKRLVRTETNYFNNQADAMAYEELGIDKYVFVATLDSRTSETCQVHDGQVYEYKDMDVGYNFPPLHPNCRSKTRGYLGEEAEKHLKRRARNPVTGKNEVIDNITYKDWIKQHGLGANNTSNTLSNHPKPKLLGNVDVKDTSKINKVIKEYENRIKSDIIENAIVVTKTGEIYQCFGNATNVWPDIDLKDKLIGAIVTHNHPKEETFFGFSQEDIRLFEKYQLKQLRGIDYKYTYELNRTKKPAITQPTEKDVGLEHIKSIQYGIDNNVYYMRWKND